MILDLRDNPGGYLYPAKQISNALLKKDQTIVITKSNMGEEEIGDKTEKEMMKEMWTMTKQMQRDVSQTKLEAKMAHGAADKSCAKIGGIKQNIISIQTTIAAMKEKDDKTEKRRHDIQNMTRMRRN